MANYTTQLRTILEMHSTMERSGYEKIPEVIDKGRPFIFDFYYPIFDENYREPLERKILMHFYTREICEETVGLWKLRLCDKLNEIMPYYNQLYESELLKFNPFYDIDYTMVHKGRANERKTQDGKQETESSTDYNEGVDTGYTLDMVGNIIDNTKSTEDTTTKTVEDKDTDYEGNVETNEHVVTNIDTKDDKTTHIDEITDRDLSKEVKLNDVEKTVYQEQQREDKTEHKIGDNDTNLTDKGKDIDTTVIDETVVRTPNLKNERQNDKIFDDTGTGADNRNIQRSEYTSDDAETKGKETTETESHKNTSTIDLYSDTPQGNLDRVDNGMGGTSGDDQSLTRKLDTGWLTNARQIDGVENQHDKGERNTESYTENHKKFDETTDDDVYHTRNYKQVTDDKTVTTDTGNETSKKDGVDTVTHDIDETHFTHYDIDETVTTEDVKSKSATTDFSREQTENTKEKEITNDTTDKTENEVLHTTDDKERTQTEQTKWHKDETGVTDFTGNVTGNEDYTRDKTDKHTYKSDKDTISKKGFVEAVTDSLKHNIRNTDEYINHAVGKISDMTYSKMLLEFRETFLNIDQMILEELNDLFFMLY